MSSPSVAQVSTANLSDQADALCDELQVLDLVLFHADGRLEGVIRCYADVS